MGMYGKLMSLDVHVYPMVSLYPMESLDLSCRYLWIKTGAQSMYTTVIDKMVVLSLQVIHCKLSQCEQVAHDDKTALQMFCQLALGKSLLAEVVSR